MSTYETKTESLEKLWKGLNGFRVQQRMKLTHIYMVPDTPYFQNL